MHAAGPSRLCARGATGHPLPFPRRAVGRLPVRAHTACGCHTLQGFLFPVAQSFWWPWWPAPHRGSTHVVIVLRRRLRARPVSSLAALAGGRAGGRGPSAGHGWRLCGRRPPFPMSWAQPVSRRWKHTSSIRHHTSSALSSHVEPERTRENPRVPPQPSAMAPRQPWSQPVRVPPSPADLCLKTGFCLDTEGGFSVAGFTDFRSTFPCNSLTNALQICSTFLFCFLR